MGALLPLLGLNSGEEFPEWYRKRFLDASDDQDEVAFRIILNAMLRVDRVSAPGDVLRLWKDASSDGYLGQSVCMQIDHALRRHRLFHTASGYLGLGPPTIQPKDLVCVLRGCSMPLVLRQVDCHHVLVGQCHVLGLMDGEGVQRIGGGQVEPMQFQIV